MCKALCDAVKEERQRGELTESIAALIQKNNQDTSAEELQEILSILLRIEHKIENFSSELSGDNTHSSTSSVQKESKEETTDTADMNDDVFSAVMSMFG